MVDFRAKQSKWDDSVATAQEQADFAMQHQMGGQTLQQVDVLQAGLLGAGAPGPGLGVKGGLAILNELKLATLLKYMGAWAIVSGILRGRTGEIANEEAAKLGDALGIKLTDTDIKFAQAKVQYTQPIPEIENGKIVGWKIQDPDGTKTRQLLYEAGFQKQDQDTILEQWNSERFLNTEALNTVGSLPEDFRRPGENPANAAERYFKEQQAQQEKITQNIAEIQAAGSAFQLPTGTPAEQTATALSSPSTRQIKQSQGVQVPESVNESPTAVQAPLLAELSPEAQNFRAQAKQEQKAAIATSSASSAARAGVTNRPPATPANFSPLSTEDIYRMELRKRGLKR